MNVQNVSSAPSYISNFINHNFTKLIEIYDEGKTNEGSGVLSFKCSQKDNKMDVFYLNEINILTQITKVTWENLKESTDKKIFMVNDLDTNSVFLIYI